MKFTIQCPCGTPFLAHKERRIYCSHSCRARFETLGRKHKEATKLKIAKTFALKSLRTCSECGVLFSGRRRKQFCTPKCAYAARDKYLTLQGRTSISNYMKAAPHRGWHTRGRGNAAASFAEKYWEKAFAERAITGFSREHVIQAKDIGLENATRIFLDFYFPTPRLNLEIDGKQHQKLGKIVKDQKRDAALAAHGIKVVRFPWKGLKYKEELEKQVNEFLALLS